MLATELASAVVVLVSQFVLLAKVAPAEVQGYGARYRSEGWLRVALPLGLISSFSKSSSQRTAAVISALGSFIGVGYEEERPGEHRTTAEQVIRDDEPWKRGVTEPIEAQKSSKFFALYDEEQRAHIMRRLRPTDLCELPMLRERR